MLYSRVKWNHAATCYIPESQPDLGYLSYYWTGVIQINTCSPPVQLNTEQLPYVTPLNRLLPKGQRISRHSILPIEGLMVLNFAIGNQTCSHPLLP